MPFLTKLQRGSCLLPGSIRGVLAWLNWSAVFAVYLHEVVKIFALLSDRRFGWCAQVLHWSKKSFIIIVRKKMQQIFISYSGCLWKYHQSGSASFECSLNCLVWFILRVSFWKPSLWQAWVSELSSRGIVYSIKVQIMCLKVSFVPFMLRL